MEEQLLTLFGAVQCDECPLLKICRLNTAVYEKSICAELRKKGDK